MKSGHHLVEREARRVLRHMAEARLERRACGDYALAMRAGGRVRLSVAAETVMAFQCEGWVAPADDGRLALTDQGRAFAMRDRAAPGAAFRVQHGEVIDLGGGLRQERAGTPLDGLARLKGEDGAPYLDTLQRQAADRLQEDFERAHFRPRLTLDICVPAHRSGGAAERQSASTLDARRRVMAALAAAGPGLGDLLFETVCLARGLNEAERGFGWPKRSGKAILRLGLDRLAAHYGLTSGQRQPGRIEVWMQAVAEG